MLRLFAIPLLIITILNSSRGQAGIYSENDIKLQDLYIEAQLEKHKGNWDAQIELLREVIRRDRRADAAYYELARAYVQKEDLSQAEKNINYALEIKPDNLWYLVLSVDIYEQSSQYDKAIEACQSLIDREPKNMDHLERLAFNYLSNEQADEAIATLERIEKINGITENTSKKKFDIQDKLGRHSAAAQTLRSLSKAFPGNLRFMNNLAGYLLKHSRRTEALAVYSEVLQRDPNNTTARLVMARENPESNESESLEAVAQLMGKEDQDLDLIIKEMMPYMANMNPSGPQTDRLLALSASLLEHYPDNVKALAVRADILFYSGDIQASAKMYAKAIELDDTQYSLWDQWLLNLWELGDYRSMYEKAEEAIDFFPNQFNALMYYIIASHKTARHQEAHNFLNEAQLIAGNNPANTLSLYIVRSWVDKSNAGLSDLEKNLSGLDQLNISNPLYYELSGDVFRHLGKPEKTREYWNKAIELGANANRIQEKMGQLN